MKLATPEGQRLLDENELVQECVRLFRSTGSPEKLLDYPGRFIGAGSHSYTWNVGEFLVKFSSPTSSHAAFTLGHPVPPEDLEEQFTFLRELRDYLAERPEANMTVPEQYFVQKNRFGAFMLVQEFMAERVSLAKRLEQELEYSPEDDAFFGELREGFTQRLIAVAEGTAFAPMLNDLIKPYKKWIHAGNLLVRPEEPLGAEMSLCIIDQPGTPIEERQRIKKLLENHRKY